uniref:Transposase n=1 Tax=Erpetoichthys calabaricus TaxID=27687 RepID=A0A8C4RP95_ERPCA
VTRRKVRKNRKRNLKLHQSLGRHPARVQGMASRRLTWNRQTNAQISWDPAPLYCLQSRVKMGAKVRVIQKATIELKNELKKDNKDKETRLFKHFDVNFKGMLQKLVAHIEETKSKLKMLADQINDITDQVEDVKQVFTARVETAEQLASNADEKATAANSECKKLGDRLAVLEDECRRNNIRIEGIPEKRESSSPVKFAVELLSKIIEDDFKLDIGIAAAYRTNRPSTFKPRSFIVRFERLRYEIIYENTHIRIFPDFSPATAAKCITFYSIKQHLRRAEIRYSLLYPAKLKVVIEDQFYIFFIFSEFIKST